MRAEVKYWRNSVIKKRIMLRQFSALGIGLTAVCLALACGSDNGGDPPADDEKEVEPNPVDQCDIDPSRAGCPGDGSGTEPGPGIEPNPGTGGAGGQTPPPTPEDAARLEVESILLANCGSCHGTQLTDRTARAGLNYINDVEQLAKSGKIRPLDSERSPIIVRMRSGTMPPPNEGGRPVPKDQIDIVANYINNPTFWPEVPRETCLDNPPMSFDTLYENVARDLTRQDVEDRPFMRYISLDNRVGAGVCRDTTLDIDRQALTKMINSLSIDPSVYRPEPANTEQTLFRIDLRQLQWNREIVVDGVAFPDVWEAIVNANPYAVPFEGDEADDARADAVTEVPVMFLDSMLDVSIIGNLYYAIIDVDINQTIDTFVSDELLIDVAANLEDEELVRAGTTRSDISEQDRLVEGHELGVRGGFYYQSFDFEDVQNESIFQDPFGFNEGGREAIFTLPNNMLAYLIADANGVLVQDSDILVDPQQNNARAVTSVSCAYCHATGLIPFADEVREVVQQTARNLIADGTLNQEQLEQLETVYLEPRAFEERLKQESELYLNALRQADLPVDGTEPVSAVFLGFDLDMGLREAAGDLGLSAEELEGELNLLDPALGVLKRGIIDRDDFTALYAVTLCELSAVNDNRPQQAFCDAAIAELGN
jgi:mono/diheme cytochrome c family protein